MISTHTLRATCLVASLSCHALWAPPATAHVPGDLESDGGHSLGLAQGGMAALSGQSSVRANPAMLTLEKQYTLSAGYHWPAFGRGFYQAGVVDSKTSPVAAGLMYTGFRPRPKPLASSSTTDAAAEGISPEDLYHASLSSRLHVGLGYVFQEKIALGMQIQHIKACQEAMLGCTKRIEDTTLGFGLAGLVTPQLRFGASLENLANDAFRDYAPRIYRLALAQTLFSGDITVHMDYRQRQRLSFESTSLSATNPATNPDTDPSTPPDERLLSGSFSIRTQDLLRVLGGYAQSLDTQKRQSLSGGLALVNEAFSLSYLLSRPYIQENKLHHGVNLTVGMMF